MMYKSSFKRTNTIRRAPDDDGITPSETFVEVCAVCGAAQYPNIAVGPAVQVNSVVLPADVILVGDTYYIVFIQHESCRRLFELNPLAYEG